MARRGGEQVDVCSVVGCGKEAARSLSGRRVAKALPELELAEGRRAQLCRDHYKEFKKATKGDRTIDRLTW